MKLPDFDQRILQWFDKHGRKHLPWQQNPTGYRVWVSEIMLQQTQVTTVIPFYERFMARFPSLATLAEAHIDDVLAHWSGLGYYARARNLHRCAEAVMRHHAGELPRSVDELQALPGIGRSTAGAIVSLSHGMAEPILDGNVKRVLARHRAIDGWPGRTAVLNELWAVSESVTPAKRCGEFNQAMMDLGATLCVRTKPQCSACPVADDCQALAEGNPVAYPGKKPKKVKPVKSTVMLLVRNDESRILLEKRPPTGIWGGLWSLPEVGDGHRAAQVGESVMRFRHTFSHFHLDIDVVQIRADAYSASHARLEDSVLESVAHPIEGLPKELADDALSETSERVWWDNRETLPGGIAAPVANILSATHGDLL